MMRCRGANRDDTRCPRTAIEGGDGLCEIGHLNLYSGQDMYDATAQGDGDPGPDPLAEHIPSVLGGPEPEMVEHPTHYGGDSVYEVIKVLEAWGLENDALLWNVVKYVARSYLKGNLLEDLKKARFYLDHRISQLENGS